MCGIAGFYDLDRTLDRQGLQTLGQRLTQSIAHRGPDGQGVWQDSDVPMVLGHRRLSIIDLSPDGAQPMESASGRYEIVFNGEIYNFQTLRRELEVEGAHFRGRSDTEIMLAAFEFWGINRALQRFNGMFAFALWDRKKRQLHLARDRMGEKPLYVGWAGKHFVFGSELKAFRAHPNFRPEVNRNALTLYMRFNCVPSPHTIYQGVWQLPPGHRMTLVFDVLSAGDDLSKEWESYWHHARMVEEACHNPLPGDDIQLTDQLESLLKDCIRERMVSDVPLGAFLSGGIDSSTIVALMQTQSTQRIKTFSIGFNEGGYNEAEAAKTIARHLGTDHHEMILDAQQAMAVIPQLPGIYDEPFADASQIPTFLVSKFARQHVTVALSGDGGDEMMGGYVRHSAIPALWRRVGWWPEPLRNIAGDVIRHIPMDRWDKIVRHYPQFGERIYKVADILKLKSMEDIYIHVMSQWDNPSALVRNGREPLTVLHDPSWQPRELSFAERMMYGDALFYMPNDILVKLDRASMAVALEARAPLLDHRIFEFCWRLPLDTKIRQGRGKWLLRQVLARHVPDHLFDRPKQGFAVPLAEWLRGPLRDWAHELLNPMAIEQQEFFNPTQIMQTWQEHLSGKGNHAHRLWTVLMFQAWHNRWVSKKDLQNVD